MYFRSYTCITELIHVFQILYMSYRAYTYLTEHILILFMCEGTRRYDKSEHIRLMQIHIKYGH